jgi:energy-converting hydrogenase Eha subunit E
MPKYLQAAYYFITGIWPLVHIASFEKITGPKTDKWLVKMVGLQAASIGIVLLAANSRHDLKILGALSAASFVVIDLYYVITGRISKIYLADAAINSLFLTYWFFV